VGLRPAERLFVSRHTVGYHLHKVYAQLGIASRAELGQLDLDDDDSRWPHLQGLPAARSDKRQRD
jgi:hypothetical protein